MDKDTKSATEKSRKVDGGIMLENAQGEEVFLPDPSPTEFTNQRDVQCNLSALLILIVEQQAMLSEMLAFMVEHGIMSEAGLVKVTSARLDTKLTTPIYADFYEHFIELFHRTKWYLMSGEEKAAYTASAEKFAKGEKEEENKNKDE